MKIKILITFFLLVFGGVAYFAYPIISNRYFQSSPGASEEENSSEKENKKSFFNNASEDNNADENDNIPDESTVPDDVFIEVDTEDCEDGCEQFEDADDKKYCQEYCGLNTPPTTADDCDKLADLEKDYCWKNQALTKKDFSLCKKIVDKKILESCKTRLTEEVLNGSGVNE
jgi:hypothetical protein